MLECATLVANTSELDFTVGPALPTTQLSFPDDEFGRLPSTTGSHPTLSTSTSAASTLVTTPLDERPEPDWSTPVAQRATRGNGSTSTLDDSVPTLRLRLAESSPALINKRVPESWRAQRQHTLQTPADFPVPPSLRNGNLQVPQLTLSPMGAGSPQMLGGSPCGAAKRVRRTQSMFPSSQQFVNAEMGPLMLPPPTSPAPVLDQVPCFTVVEDSFPRITSQTLINLLDGKISHHYDDIIVIDCRFEYEYAGGHIAGAVNISCKSKLEQFMFGADAKFRGKPLVIFHCEYSAYRGPLMATHLRQCDRRANVYPHLKYPDIAVLNGGYSNFYAINRARCEPQNYVGMNDDSYKVTCEREMERFRTGMRFRKSQLFSRPSITDLPRTKFELHQRANQSCSMLPLAQAFEGERTVLRSLNM